MENQAEYITQRAKRENAALKKYAAIQKASEDRIGCQKIYIDMTGDIEAAFVLDELVFYSLPRNGQKSALRIWKDGYLWMAVQRAEWWERKRLTARQADTAIEKLQKQNLIVKSVHKFNGQTTVHLRLNTPEFFKLYGEKLEQDNPPEDEADTIARDINDLYAMMGGELQNRESQICEGELQNRETELQNGDSINSLNTITTQSLPAPLSRTDIPRRGDLVDGYIAMFNAPGIKREARIDAILSYLAVQFGLNTETKRWREFAKFADGQKQNFGWGVEVFVQWLKSQKDFDIAFWSPQKMMEHYPRAFQQAQKTDIVELL